MVTFLRGFSADGSNGECELQRTRFSRDRQSGDRSMLGDMEGAAFPARMRLLNLPAIATRKACRERTHGAAILQPIFERAERKMNVVIGN